MERSLHRWSTVSSSVAAELAARFERNGFVVLERFFSDALMSELDESIVAHYGKAPAPTHTDEFIERAAVEVVPWFPHLESVEAFERVEQLGPLLAVTDALLGRGWRSDYCMVMHSAARSAGQAWHQDCPPERPSQFNLNRLVYTRDIPPEVGGQLVVVPGSHLLGELPAGDPHASVGGEVTIAPHRGDLVLVHGHCWHRVTAIGDKPRVSVNFRALPSGAADGLTDVCVYRTMRYRFSTSDVLVDRR